ncbi:hypothetical protein [Kribbella deserti]|uniref:Uncharacterized protein n=1 Tax=Kribbella deserti TaxID=1926257 RepID=A0ABV6QNI5_9ACTN
MKLSDSSMIDLIRSVDPEPGDEPTPADDVLRERARRLTLTTGSQEPAQRAALLDEFATRDDIRYVGTTRDRANRPAYAFAYDTDRGGLPNRRVLLIGANGHLLSAEEILTRDAGKLNVTIPSTISFGLYLSTRYR